jgi:hypothetical protein
MPPRAEKGVGGRRKGRHALSERADLVDHPERDFLVEVGEVGDRQLWTAVSDQRGGAQASLVAFDLLRLDGDDLRLRPIEARRKALLRLVANIDGILFNETLAVEGAVVFAKACELGFEGVVSKRAGSL